MVFITSEALSHPSITGVERLLGFPPRPPLYDGVLRLLARTPTPQPHESHHPELNWGLRHTKASSVPLDHDGALRLGNDPSGPTFGRSVASVARSLASPAGIEPATRSP